MGETPVLELPDELYEVVRRQAALTGKTTDELAAEWIARNGPKPRRRLDDPARTAALDRLRPYAGAVQTGNPRSADLGVHHVLNEPAGLPDAAADYRGRSMAWEGLECGKVRGMTGDAPFDLMRSAVERIRREYLERFGRNPYLAELLYPLLHMIEADPSAFVADRKLPSVRRLLELIDAESCPEHIEPGDYYGALDEETDDFLVLPESAPRGVKSRDSIVLRGRVIEEEKNRILCRYSVLSPAITDTMAEGLIRLRVLRDLLDYNIIDGRLTIRFERA